MALLFFVAPAFAQQTPSPSSSDNSADMVQIIHRLQEALRARDEAILNLQHRVDALEKQAQTPSSGTSTMPGAAFQPSTTPRTSAELYDEEERMARTALDRTLIQRGGLLLPKWTVEVEHNTTYYNSSSDRVSIDGFAILPVLVVGDILSQKVKRDIALGAVTSRIGLPKEFQFEVRLPYGYESERRIWADNRQESSHSLGIGDLEVAAIKQITHEGARWPALLASARWKSTTGSDPFHIGGNTPTLGNGFHGVQGTLTAVKSSDPAVLFGGFSYTANLAGDKGIAGLDSQHPDKITLGHVDPGDAMGFNVGAALSINPETSLNAAWQQTFTRSSTLNHVRVPGSFLNEAILRLGSTYTYMPGRVVDVGLGIGMTRDSPDFQFSIAFPFRFSLKRSKPTAASAPKRDPGKQTTTTTAQISAQNTSSSTR